MDKKEREVIRQRRDEAIEFVNAEMTGKKERYTAFVKEMEGTSLEGGAPGMEEIVEFYNKRGAKERIFDDLNNSFGWNRLPKSFMNENTVFLLITALIRNFYQFLVQAKDLKSFGLTPTSRLKDFTFKFINVPAKWIKTARQFVLNIYTEQNAYATIFKSDFG